MKKRLTKESTKTNFIKSSNYFKSLICERIFQIYWLLWQKYIRYAAFEMSFKKFTTHFSHECVVNEYEIEDEFCFANEQILRHLLDIYRNGIYCASLLRVDNS
jgi:hypothetical protein